MCNRKTIAAIALAALVTVPACSNLERGGDDEIKVTLDQVPAAVRQTLEAEAKGAAISEIEKETENGQTVYEAETTIDGKPVELTIGEDGKLIAREDEDAEDDDDAEGEDDDDNGKDD